MSFDILSLRRLPVAFNRQRQNEFATAAAALIAAIVILVLAPQSVAPTLFNATTIVIAAIAVALPLHSGFLNVGVEGQMLVGGLAAAAVGTTLVGDWPRPLALTACIAAAIAGGVLVILPAWALRRYFRVPEVISTILLNFAAQAVTNYFTIKIMPAGGAYSDRTPVLPLNAQLPPLPWYSTYLNLTTVIAVLLVIGYWRVLRSDAMLSIRAAGSNEAAAELAGRRPHQARFITTMVGGAIAGLASCNQVLGYLHGFKDNFAAGIGFTAIIVAVLAPSFPAIAVVALLLGFVQYALIYVQGLGTTSEIGNLFQAVLLIGCLLFLRRKR